MNGCGNVHVGYPEKLFKLPCVTERIDVAVVRNEQVGIARNNGFRRAAAFLVRHAAIPLQSRCKLVAVVELRSDRYLYG